ncbi:hypothetical protein AAFF_G00214320 [Aldrovandia affinis]|uniref:Uncharacterized protein n=1 Tax=Aldrovandia affinis TaxID=143900 RepID=A0AAD7W4W3_9TELE|nr:hypothetical protein AAFF_G00214320 [Aldrovandia affinis]
MVTTEPEVSEATRVTDCGLRPARDHGIVTVSTGRSPAPSHNGDIPRDQPPTAGSLNKGGACSQGEEEEEEEDEYEEEDEEEEEEFDEEEQEEEQTLMTLLSEIVFLNQPVKGGGSGLPEDSE